MNAIPTRNTTTAPKLNLALIFKTSAAERAIKEIPRI
jgi:hypothetical protein